MKYNLGCGGHLPDGWVNVDYALGARLSKLPIFKLINKKLGLFNIDWNDKIFIHDLTTEFPWETNSADVVYSSHTLEHMSKKDGRYFLEESFRILKKGGILRIVVPDLGRTIDEYLSGRLNADDFVIELDVLYTESGSYVKNKLSPLFQYPHKCMYDTKALLRIFNEIGFTAKSCEPFVSEIESIGNIENKERANNAVIVEGVKL
ncbi:MAG: methyltransferase type 11 [Thiothrix sp.]|nr:MAG: methyltransferase type 11 [Thiothrix sp.]